MTSFKKVDEANFELPCAFTWGVRKDKYSGYSIPVALDDETAEKVADLGNKHNTNSSIYGNTIYIRVRNLSPKQKSELLDKGRCHIEIKFELEGINTAKSGARYLTFKITKLRKIEDPPETGECPED